MQMFAHAVNGKNSQIIHFYFETR